jgi:hypothetical protein
VSINCRFWVSTEAVTAIARELIAFMWAIAKAVPVTS